MALSPRFVILERHARAPMPRSSAARGWTPSARASSSSDVPGSPMLPHGSRPSAWAGRSVRGAERKSLRAGDNRAGLAGSRRLLGCRL